MSRFKEAQTILVKCSENILHKTIKSILAYSIAKVANFNFIILHTEWIQISWVDF